MARTNVSKSTSGVMEPMTSDYNKLNALQSTVWKFAHPLFAKAMDEIFGWRKKQSSNIVSSSFQVADFGCATGGNSVAPLSFVAS
jgi:hypothetical protein